MRICNKFLSLIASLLGYFLFCQSGFASSWESSFSDSYQRNFSFLAKLSHEYCWHPVLALTGGLAFSSDTGESQNFPIIDSSHYAYSADDSDAWRGLFGGFAGIEVLINQAWALQAGFAFYQTSLAASGSITQGADAQSSDQFNYHYNITSNQTLIEGKLLYHWNQIYHPYVTLGLGAAFNSANDYTTNVPPFLTFTPMFANHTTDSFTYRIGVGVDVDVPVNFRFGLGYRFADLGETKLGSGHIDTVAISNTLKHSHLYTNEVVAQMTYLLS